MKRELREVFGLGREHAKRVSNPDKAKQKKKQFFILLIYLNYYFLSVATCVRVSKYPFLYKIQ